MTSGRIKKAVAAGAMILGLSVGLAHAGDEQVKARQAHMKANGEAIGLFVKMIKGEQPYDAAAVKAAMGTIAARDEAAEAAKAWDPGSNDGATVKSYAKPEIWSDAAGFAKAYEAYEASTKALAASTDEASFKTAFNDWGNSCKGCHEKYRAPKE
jgi:cytochrome c556